MLSGQATTKEVHVWGVLLHIWGALALLILPSLVQRLVVRLDAGLPEKSPQQARARRLPPIVAAATRLYCWLPALPLKIKVLLS